MAALTYEESWLRPVNKYPPIIRWGSKWIWIIEPELMKCGKTMPADSAVKPGISQWGRCISLLCASTLSHQNTKLRQPGNVWGWAFESTFSNSANIVAAALHLVLSSVSSRYEGYERARGSTTTVLHDKLRSRESNSENSLCTYTVPTIYVESYRIYAYAYAPLCKCGTPGIMPFITFTQCSFLRFALLQRALFSHSHFPISIPPLCNHTAPV